MDPTILALQATGGFVVGSLIGYAIRKAAKLALVAIGFTLLPVFGLWSLGVLNVNWAKVNELAGTAITWLGVNLSNMSLALASTGALGISGILGFFFGATGGLTHTIFPETGSSPRRYVKRKNHDIEE